MRLHRFFVASNIDKEKINTFSSEALLHQMKSVFRFHEGIQFILFNGEAVDYVCEAVSLTRKELVFRVLETRAVKRYSACNLALAFSLIKKDNVEWIVQKGTELGVSEFIPLVSERSEKKGFNVERANRIIIEACEQSGRAEVPVIREAQTLSDFLRDESRKIVVLHTGGTNFDQSLLDAGKGGASGEGGARDIVVCIGPEGGWSDREMGEFVSAGATTMTLPTPVLRAETAAIAAATLFLAR
jgi:16S rRNA (uracil1498-N3)-methyltransferase